MKEYFDINKSIGLRIRQYRKQSNYTLEEFAKLINKSKSSLSKYEKGETMIDICLLYEIASALNVSLYQLIDTDKVELDFLKLKQCNNQKIELLYVYVWDGKLKRNLRKGVLEISNVSDDVLYYSDVESFDNYKICQYLYQGTKQKNDSANRNILINRINKHDILILNYYDSLSIDNTSIGFLSSFSLGHYLPYSTKCLISSKILIETDELIKKLKLSSSELKNIKKYNSFSVDYQIF